MPTLRLLPLLCRCTLAVSWASMLGAATIYNEYFATPRDAHIDMVDQSPPVIGPGLGLDGGTWQAHGSAIYSRFKKNGDLWLGPDTGVILPLGAAPGFRMPAEITITATVNVGGFPKRADFRAKGVGFGFFANGPQTDGFAFTSFVGITVSNDGKLRLLKDPDTTSGPVPWELASVDIAGWLPNANNTLSYTIDVATGAITHLTFKVGGNAVVDYTSSFSPFTGVFTKDRLFDVGLYGNAEARTASGATSTAYVKNFNVESGSVVAPTQAPARPANPKSAIHDPKSAISP